MNKVILMGRLTRDPEMRQTTNGTTMARFTIAVDRRFANRDGQRQTDFISCTAWRQQAEFLCRYFHKGNMVAVIGNLQSRSWDGADGKKNYATDVIVDEVYFTGEKTQGGGYQGGFQQNSYQQNSYQQPQQFNQSQPQSIPQQSGGFDDDDFGFSSFGDSEDDLPF